MKDKLRAPDGLKGISINLVGHFNFVLKKRVKDGYTIIDYIPLEDVFELIENNDEDNLNSIIKYTRQEKYNKGRKHILLYHITNMIRSNFEHLWDDILTESDINRLKSALFRMYRVYNTARDV
jgi:hypothetical protein